MVFVLNTLLRLNIQSYIEVEMMNPVGAPLYVEYEFPWGRDSFEAVEGVYRVDVPPLAPGKYEWVVRWSGGEVCLNVAVEVSEVGGPRRRFNFDLE